MLSMYDFIYDLYLSLGKFPAVFLSSGILWHFGLGLQSALESRNNNRSLL